MFEFSQYKVGKLIKLIARTDGNGPSTCCAVRSHNMSAQEIAQQVNGKNETSKHDEYTDGGKHVSKVR